MSDQVVPMRVTWIRWSDGGEELSLRLMATHHHDGQINPRNELYDLGRRLAFEGDFHSTITSCFKAETPRYERLAPKLARAKRDLAELERNIRRHDLDREEALDRLTGEELTKRLSEIQGEREAAQQRIANSAAGLEELNSEVAEERWSFIRACAGHVRRIVEERVEALLSTRPDIRNHLTCLEDLQRFFIIDKAISLLRDENEPWATAISGLPENLRQAIAESDAIHKAAQEQEEKREKEHRQRRDVAMYQ